MAAVLIHVDVGTQVFEASVRTVIDFHSNRIVARHLRARSITPTEAESLFSSMLEQRPLLQMEN